MAATLDLIGKLYDVLSNTLGTDEHTNILQIGWPGIALSPADFRAADSPRGGYDRQTSEETFSFLANIAPTGNPLRFENSGFEIDDIYQILLFSAIPLGASADDLPANPMYKLFADAQYDFVRTQKGSIRDPNVFYQPCRAMPADWFTEAAALNWPRISLSSSQTAPPARDSAFIRKGGDKLIEEGVWKLAPQNMSSGELENKVRAAAAAKAAALEARLKPATEAVRKPAAMRRATAMRHAATDDPAFAARFNALNASRAARTGLRPAPVFRAEAPLPDMQVDAQQFSVVAPANVALNRRLAASDLLNRQMNVRPVAPDSGGFNISFKFCRVNIDRGGWYRNALLNMRNWYMFNTKAGEYASAKAGGDSGIFPLLPDSLLAIRDLSISANWSRQDIDYIRQARAFGPFNIGAGGGGRNTLEAQGLQVIAWTSRINPLLPPMDDPNMQG